LDIRIRLQPIWKFGVTLARRSGSLIPFAMLASANFLAGAASFGFQTKPGT
jgi:hypothetical protein